MNGISITHWQALSNGGNIEHASIPAMQASDKKYRWNQSCLFFVDLRILITPLVSSRYSLSFLCCVCLAVFAFVLYLVSNIACVSGLSIHDCPFCFLYHLFKLCEQKWKSYHSLKCLLYAEYSTLITFMLNIMINKTINEPMFYFYYPTIKACRLMWSYMTKYLTIMYSECANKTFRSVWY